MLPEARAMIRGCVRSSAATCAAMIADQSGVAVNQLDLLPEGGIARWRYLPKTGRWPTAPEMVLCHRPIGRRATGAPGRYGTPVTPCRPQEEKRGARFDVTLRMI